MPQRALTDRFCARVKTREGEAQTDYFGETTAGLALRITRSGHRASPPAAFPMYTPFTPKPENPLGR
jgi:hypothetical protein